MKKTYTEKLKNINDWVEIVNHHWARLKGNLHNDEVFWNQTLHSMKDLDWWDWIDIEPSIAIQYEGEYRRYPKLAQDTQNVKKKLMFGKPVVKKGQAMKNTEAFRLLMQIKDLINDINGTPTKKFPKNATPPPEEITTKNNFWDMFEQK